MKHNIGRLTSIFACILLASALRAQDKQSDAPQFLQEFQKVRSEFEIALRADLLKYGNKLNPGTVNKGERVKILGQLSIKRNELFIPVSKKLIEIAKLHGEDPAVLEIIKYLFQFNSKNADEAARIIKTHHLSNQDAMNALYSYDITHGSNNTWYEAVLGEILASDSLSKADRPRIKLMLAKYLIEIRDQSDRLKILNQDKLKPIEERLGKEWVNTLKKRDTSEIETKTVALLSDLIKNHPSEQIGEQAAEYLYEAQNIAVNKKAPETKGKDLSDADVDLGEYRGKVVLLVFWSSEMLNDVPHINRLAEKSKDKPFIILGVNLDAEKTTAVSTAAEKQLKWRSIWSGPKILEETIPKAWGVRSWPSAFLIDSNGIIRSKVVPTQLLTDEQIETLLSNVKK